MRRFWEHLATCGEKTALVDSRRERVLSYRQLSDEVAKGREALSRFRRTVVCLAIEMDIEGVCCYLSALAAGHVVWLYGAEGDSGAGCPLIQHYLPGLVLWRPPKLAALRTSLSGAVQAPLFGYEMASLGEPFETLRPELAVLLATSGSSGTPKLARLSYENVLSSTQQATAALNVCADDRALAALPWHHVYGLSVLQSALSVGAALVIESRSVLDREFWRDLEVAGITLFPTVPTQLRFMRDSRIEVTLAATVKKLAVSGSAMDDASRGWLCRKLVPAGVDVYSMYGMTEAAGRIAVLPPEAFSDNSTSVGCAVAGGHISLLATGEIIYSGPNVMLGYAHQRADLGHADELSGQLRTGDVGRLDASGNLHLTGRLSRVCKLLDRRINLDDLELQLSALGEIAVVTDDRSIDVLYAGDEDLTGVRAQVNRIADELRMPRQLFRVARISAIPRTHSGKRCYASLRLPLPL